VYAERRYGFELNSRKSLNEFTFVRAGYRFEDVNIHDVDPDAPKEIQDSKRSFLQSMLSAGITYDTRDSLMLTRRGERLEFQTYGAGGPLGGDVQIYGFSLEGSKYFNLAWDTILILNAEVANVDTWGGGSSVPIFDRLYLGGANNLRGFRYRDVGPKDSSGKGEPIGGSSLVRGTVEYTMPVMDKVRAAVFYDVGAVNSKSYSFSGNLNSDVGVGLRLDLPIGPVRIDYGIPMAADKYNDGGGRFNFNVGYQF
jgi:outer membrane protein insertion porin family